MTLSDALLILATVLPGQADVQEFSHNFRGRRMPPAERMDLAGLDPMVEVTPEEEGLRIKVHADRGRDGVGLQSRLRLTGDFEITASYEILSADLPTRGYGVGVNLSVSPGDWKNKRAGIARYWTVRNGSGFQSMILDRTAPKPVEQFAWEPSETRQGQLRLRREGATLLYLVNEGLGQPFREVFHCDYGVEDIDMLRLVANPGNSPAAVDVRLFDIQLYWGGLPARPATAATPEVPVAGPPGEEGPAHPPRHRWTLALCSLVLLLGAGAITLVLVQRRRGRAAHSPSP
jgi:hypothetical protein